MAPHYVVFCPVLQVSETFLNPNHDDNFVSSEYKQPGVNKFPKTLGATSKFWCQKDEMKQVPY